MTPLEIATVTVAMEALSWYRDMGILVNQSVIRKRVEMLMPTVNTLGADGGNKAAAALALLERLGPWK